MLSTRQETKSSSEIVYYLDLYPHSSSYYTQRLGFSDFRVNVIYLASLYAPLGNREGTTDLWGGIKIPSLDPLDFDHQGEDGVAITGSPGYASLLGVPVNMKTCANAAKFTFNMNTTIFTAHCEEPKIFDTDFMAFPRHNGPFILKTPRTHAPEVTILNISMISFAGDIVFSRSTNEWSRTNVIVHDCTIILNFLVVNVECQSNHCEVTRIRKIDDPDHQLANGRFSKDMWDEIARLLPASAGFQGIRDISPTERYLYDPQKLVYLAREGMNLSQVPIREFNKRLTTVLNTYYQAAIDHTIRLEFAYNSLVRETVATAYTILPSTYQRHWEWVISAFVASTAMLVVSIGSILIHRQVICPDIYGYVSSMTRDNPHFPLPPNGCALDGDRRAVLLKDVVVRFEDVTPERKIGHLAFTMAGYKTPTEQAIHCRLKGTKLYSGRL
jgi:hypothetical protein